MTDNPIDPTGAVAELLEVLNTTTAMDDALPRVLTLTLRHLPAAEEASITLIRNQRAHTVAAVGELARELDELQYEKGHGPCLDAGRAAEIMLIDDASTETRWPDYLPPARERGLGSSLSLPLPVENYLVGALNVYSRTAAAFGPRTAEVGAALAACLTSALSYAESHHQALARNTHLEQAMLSRGVIEQAKGIIMMQRRCTAEEAFAVLRQASMDSHVKLQDLAVSLVSSASGHPTRVWTAPSPQQR